MIWEDGHIMGRTLQIVFRRVKEELAGTIDRSRLWKKAWNWFERGRFALLIELDADVNQISML